MVRQAVKRGTYALIMFLPRATEIRVGALGRFKFPRGHYVYIGSALNGLDARIARHLAGVPRSERVREFAPGHAGRWTGGENKRLFWHIDYLLQYARVLDVWTDASGKHLECAWAQAALALPNAVVLAPRFGASDCRCAAHLIHLPGTRA